MALPSLFLKAKNAITNGVKSVKDAKDATSALSSQEELKKIVKIAQVPMSFVIGIVVLIISVFILIITVPLVLFAFGGEMTSSDSGSNGGSNGGSTGGDYVQWAINIANDDSHGYNNCERYGPDYDCSSLVYYSLINNGYSTSQLGSSPFYTYTMHDYLIAAGFERHAYNASELQRGDILWRSGHTAMYIGSNQIVHATYNEFHDYCGGKVGDQTGSEITVQNGLGGSWTYYYRAS